MYYVTIPQSPQVRQMSLEELFFGTSSPVVIAKNETNTKTHEVQNISARLRKGVDIDALVTKLIDFNERNRGLFETDRHSLYRTFYIPKKSGGLRKIDAPNTELMDALRNLKSIFEEDFRALYHTSAFAYIRGRCTVDCVKRHQANESKWFAKFDLHNFFGSTTPEFVMQMFGMVFPFSEVVEQADGKAALQKALSLAFLDGGLPQGTPISPLITNIMMIPVDFRLANSLREFKWTKKNGEEITQRFVYTRYADDFQISSKYDFDSKIVEKYITKTLESFNAPFKLNESKTRYGSSSGKNYNLGVMLNGDNEITVGHRKKRRFQAMLSSFVLDTQHGTMWSLEDVMQLEGFRNYYKMVEGETIDRIVKHVGDKYGVDIVKLIKEQLRS